MLQLAVLGPQALIFQADIYGGREGRRYPSSSSGALFGAYSFGFFSSSLEDVHLKAFSTKERL